MLTPERQPQQTHSADSDAGNQPNSVTQLNAWETPREEISTPVLAISQALKERIPSGFSINERVPNESVIVPDEALLSPPSTFSSTQSIVGDAVMLDDSMKTLSR